jgi:hypothetical protein
MPQNFLHLRNGTDHTLDPEGKDYANLDEARHEAIESARELVSQSALSGKALQLGSAFEITDDAGIVVTTVCFRDAFPSD